MNIYSLLDAHRAVNRLLQQLALGMDKPRLNEAVIALSEQLFGRRLASILRHNNGHLYLEYAPHLPDFYNQAIEGVAIGPKVGSCGAAAATGKPVVASDLNQHENWQPYTELTQQANLHACWSVPILASDNTVLGTFAIYNDTPSTPTPEELEILEMVASLYAVALEKYQLEEQLHFHASRDPLTHCFNRRMLQHEVETTLIRENKRDSIIACFFVDIDSFKYINDRFGHDIGDNVLIEVAEVLKQQFVFRSVLGRYGGDEFVGFCCFDSMAELEDFSGCLERAFTNMAHIDGYQVKVSVGYSYSQSPNNDSIETMIRRADQSMYQVKHAKRSVY
ncbi:sensor domain-containing diguanylate cyclase [Vibrio brasiliensis]|uniref:diguanylate cyclase n=1 Tax=Vibrio brasiliensis LMG 20546 TaxID=945543 RepID=E8LQ24_9VIBR|nr:sensor domain-containing diguanylate cyclase [Vibrio brasiliensis]EGA67298.1 GGDEF family protein [Vibrio brasiliensis LMG 20546]